MIINHFVRKPKKKNIKSKSKTDYEAKLYELNLMIAEKTLKKKSAVCEGYSQLLSYTLNQLGIVSIVVPGYVKRFTNEIGRKRSNSNHAWNVVKKDEKWHLIDVTWSTGNSIYNKDFFNFSDTYFLIPPEKFILSHFPDDEQWQLLKKPVSKTAFFEYPIFDRAYLDSKLTIKENSTGLIKVKPDSIIKLYFSEINPKEKYYYSFNDTNKKIPLDFIYENDSYMVEIPFNYKRRKKLEISNGFWVLMKFKVIIDN